MTLKDHLEQNNYILDCPNCGKDVYKYIGRKPIPTTGTVNASVFRSLSKDITNPAPGKKMICPFCGEPLAFVVKGG